MRKFQNMEALDMLRKKVGHRDVKCNFSLLQSIIIPSSNIYLNKNMNFSEFHLFDIKKLTAKLYDIIR